MFSWQPVYQNGQNLAAANLTKSGQSGRAFTPPYGQAAIIPLHRSGAVKFRFASGFLSQFPTSRLIRDSGAPDAGTKSHRQREKICSLYNEYILPGSPNRKSGWQSGAGLFIRPLPREQGHLSENEEGREFGAYPFPIKTLGCIMKSGLFGQRIEGLPDARGKSDCSSRPKLSG